MAPRVIELRAPIGGINSRMAFQRQPPYTTADAENVHPDGSISGRTRIGSRPGLGKVFAAQLGGGNPTYLLGGVRYVTTTGGVLTNLAVATANGLFYRESSGNWSELSSSITLAKTQLQHGAEHLQKFYMNNFEAMITKQTDGALDGSKAFTSSAAGDFAAAGVNANDFVVVITDAGDGVNEIQTVTVGGSPSGGTFTLKFLGKETVDLDYNATAAEVQYALEEMASVGKGNLSVSGTAPYTITFKEVLGKLDVPLFDYTHALTGGSSPGITVAETTKGVVATAGAFTIASVVTTTITLDNSPTGSAETGVKFYIQKAPMVFDPNADTLAIWRATTNKGQVPTGCTGVAQWNGRLVLWKDKNFFVSRQEDPFDWDFSAPDTDVGRPVGGDSADGGNLGDYIKAGIPHAANCFLWGCTNSIWIQRGDFAIGQSYNLSQNIGMLDGKAWCHTPGGELFFMSLEGLYHLPAGCGAGPPSSVSREVMPEELKDIDDTAFTVTMAYDAEDRGIHIFVAKNSAGATTHYWFDHELFASSGTASFWKMVFGTTDHEPFSVWERRDSAQSKSEVYIGGRDGRPRQFDDALSQDDGSNAIASYVFYGPIRLGGSSFGEGKLLELAVTTAANSGDVDIDIYVGDSPETAFNATVYETHEFNDAGRNSSRYPMARGNTMFFKVKNGESNAEWAIESISLIATDSGRVRP